MPASVWNEIKMDAKIVPNVYAIAFQRFGKGLPSAYKSFLCKFAFKTLRIYVSGTEVFPVDAGSNSLASLRM
jgi:hypothetical protein